MRRDQDSINPRTHPDIMVLAQDSAAHPYWYARVIGVFHADIVYKDPRTGKSEHHRMEFLWVRWFGREFSPNSTFSNQRPPMLSFVKPGSSEKEAFGFIDPADIIRAVHIIPAYAYGTTTEYLGHSSIRQCLNDEGEDKDYKHYYVNM